MVRSVVKVKVGQGASTVILNIKNVDVCKSSKKIGRNKYIRECRFKFLFRLTLMAKWNKSLWHDYYVARRCTCALNFWNLPTFLLYISQFQPSIFNFTPLFPHFFGSFAFLFYRCNNLLLIQCIYLSFFFFDALIYLFKRL